MTGRIYAVGDIHGRIDFLEQALAWIQADGGMDAEIVFLGDMVDRGPAPSAVLDLLIQGQAAGRPWTVIKGNHDRMFERFIRLGQEHDDCILSGLGWLHDRLGGVATLEGYGVKDAAYRDRASLLAEARSVVPSGHMDFIASLPLYLERGPHLFVHAGIQPGIALEQQAEDDLLWIRDPFLNHRTAHPWLVVHGHTALQLPRHHGNRVNLDGGAGYGRPIYPAVFEGSDCWLLGHSGRLPLVP